MKYMYTQFASTVIYCDFCNEILTSEGFIRGAIQKINGESNEVRLIIR